MVRKCTKNSKKWMSQNGVVLAAIDVKYHDRETRLEIANCDQC